MGAGPCRGTSKVPIEGLFRSQGPIRGTSSMLALLALPLLAMSARGQVEDRSLLEDLIEDLENNSEFSQKYQASQNCMCDTEHMFACPQPKQQDDGGLSFLGGFAPVEEVKNPFLAGAKLSIAAKKGMGY